MRKRKLKKSIKVFLIMILFMSFLVSYVLYTNKTKNVSKKLASNFTYVNDYIFDNYYPVINQDQKLIKPYESDKVEVKNDFYDKDQEENVQEKSIIFHDGIYMQNSGITYSSIEEFDVISMLSGTVTNITDDSLLGKTIEISYSPNIIIMYQSLSDIAVKKGDIITQGQKIAKSGLSPLNSDVKNSLHIEIYKNGTVLNPNNFFDKSIKELSDN